MMHVTRETAMVYRTAGRRWLTEAAAYRKAAIGLYAERREWYEPGTPEMERAMKVVVRLARFLRFVDRRQERIACVERCDAIKAENDAQGHRLKPGLTLYRCECCGPIVLDEGGDGQIPVCPACNEDAGDNRGAGHVREGGLCRLTREKTDA